MKLTFVIVDCIDSKFTRYDFAVYFGVGCVATAVNTLGIFLLTRLGYVSLRCGSRMSGPSSVVVVVLKTGKDSSFFRSTGFSSSVFFYFFFYSILFFF